MSAAVNALKRVDLPTFGKPTIPHLMPMFPLEAPEAALLRRGLASVQPVRRPLGAFLDEDGNELDRVGDRADDLLCRVRRGAAAHVVHDRVAAAPARLSHAAPQPPRRPPGAPGGAAG